MKIKGWRYEKGQETWRRKWEGLTCWIRVPEEDKEIEEKHSREWLKFFQNWWKTPGHRFRSQIVVSITNKNKSTSKYKILKTVEHEKQH